MINFVKTYFPHEKCPYLAITDFWSNRFNIAMVSQGVDINKVYTYFLLHYILTNKNKKVIISSPIYTSCLELMNELLYHYKKIMKFFPDITITNSNDKSVTFSNGVNVKMYKCHKHSFITEAIDMVILQDMAFASPCQIEVFYKLCVVMLNAKTDGRFIISSVPNGNNLFYEVFKQSEEGKNIFKSFRLYYWSNPEINYEWIKAKILSLGEKEFNLKYNLSFPVKKSKNKSKRIE